ncbi:hypothetical protein DMR_32710 [Solidesulfovibrio magneticus RS-1]|uniref:Uncharacterized protein n=1 Tax=Solidesulfovibrio magneticus (strain ATCC 700980 / DSM 13731 / RS-1) TaxID=573370 RepID=C4XJL5_SOLM1|nr:hypothetical protein DMR_32710 [Solidesulfovibrio magneticus RS-1]
MTGFAFFNEKRKILTRMLYVHAQGFAHALFGLAGKPGEEAALGLPFWGAGLLMRHLLRIDQRYNPEVSCASS